MPQRRHRVHLNVPPCPTGRFAIAAGTCVMRLKSAGVNHQRLLPRIGAVNAEVFNPIAPTEA